MRSWSSIMRVGAGPAANSAGKHQPAAPAARQSGAEPRGKRLAIPAAEQAGQPGLQGLQRQHGRLDGPDAILGPNPLDRYAAVGKGRSSCRRHKPLFEQAISGCRWEKNGAQGRNRTSDTAIFSRMLYQLSYLGLGEGGMVSLGRGSDQVSSGSGSGPVSSLRHDRALDTAKTSGANSPNRPATPPRHPRSPRLPNLGWRARHTRR